MFSARAPRPWVITIAARARSSGAPAATIGWPWWGAPAPEHPPQPDLVAVAEKDASDVGDERLGHAGTAAHPHQAHRQGPIHDEVGHRPKARRSASLLRGRVVGVRADPRAA